MLVNDEKVPRHFWRISVVTGVLPSRASERKGAIVRIKKANAILKRPVNKLFLTEYTYHETNQTEEESLNIENINLLVRFNKTRNISQCY